MTAFTLASCSIHCYLDSRDLSFNIYLKLAYIICIASLKPNSHTKYSKTHALDHKQPLAKSKVYYLSKNYMPLPKIRAFRNIITNLSRI